MTKALCEIKVFQPRPSSPSLLHPFPPPPLPSYTPLNPHQTLTPSPPPPSGASTFPKFRTKIENYIKKLRDKTYKSSQHTHRLEPRLNISKRLSSYRPLINLLIWILLFIVVAVAQFSGHDVKSLDCECIVVSAQGMNKNKGDENVYPTFHGMQAIERRHQFAFLSDRLALCLFTSSTWCCFVVMRRWKLSRNFLAELFFHFTTYYRTRHERVYNLKSSRGQSLSRNSEKSSVLHQNFPIIVQLKVTVKCEPRQCAIRKLFESQNRRENKFSFSLFSLKL